ncbi:MAG: cation diffusion facilitator family transporter [Syntrophobacterales bacterium]|jgi:cation diffusion facilitator family transporter
MTNDNREISSQAIRFRAMILAISIGSLLMTVKFIAYFLTDSTAILSDALESIINVVASGFALYSIYVSNRPPDASHPYGHGKIEYFSVGFEGALIILAAVAILYKAIPAFIIERPLAQLNVGIILLLSTSAVNLVLGLFLIRTGRKTRSAPLEADGKHLLTDVYTSVVVIVGLLLVRLTGWHWLDPLAACLVAINIIFTGWHLVKEAYGRLMDEADPELLERIVEILNENRRPDWIDVHELRTRHYGDKVHVDFHLVVPRRFGLPEAHVEAEEIEKMILDTLDEVAEVIVHVDPCEDPLCKKCLQAECQDRSQAGITAVKSWRVEEVVLKRGERGE